MSIAEAKPPTIEQIFNATSIGGAVGLPLPPTFASFEAERQHRKERLAGAFRLFSKFGFDEGVAGHITARDPELTDHFWVNPFGMHFSQIKASDLCLVSHDGRLVEGKRAVNRAAFAIHAAVHAARPDVIAVAHSHSLYGKTWSAMGRLLDPIVQDACAFYGDHALFSEFTGVVYSEEEGKKIGSALGNHKALILQNHGLLTVGHSVDEAVWWFTTMERSCQSQLIAEAAGKPISIDPEMARLTQTQIGGHLTGWFQFQPLWDRISREQPDLFN